LPRRQFILGFYNYYDFLEILIFASAMCELVVIMVVNALALRALEYVDQRLLQIFVLGFVSSVELVRKSKMKELGKVVALKEIVYFFKALK